MSTEREECAKLLEDRAKELAQRVKDPAIYDISIQAYWRLLAEEMRAAAEALRTPEKRDSWLKS